jgi:hypothetical protein
LLPDPIGAPGIVKDCLGVILRCGKELGEGGIYATAILDPSRVQLSDKTSVSTI